MHRLEMISCKAKVALDCLTVRASEGNPWLHACSLQGPWRLLLWLGGVLRKSRCSQVNRQLAAVNAAITAAARSRRWQEGVDLARQILLGPEVAFGAFRCRCGPTLI